MEVTDINHTDDQENRPSILLSDDNDDDNDDENDKENEFGTIDEIANNQNLIDCYQIQVDDENNCSPVHLGKYPDIPLPVNRILKYKKYQLHVVTYVLTDDEIKNKLFKIVGVNVFRRNRKNSLCSLDLIMNDEIKNYQLIFNNHKDNTTQIVENLEKFPGKNHVLEYVINKVFEDPVKSILLS